MIRDNVLFYGVICCYSFFTLSCKNEISKNANSDSKQTKLEIQQFSEVKGMACFYADMQGFNDNATKPTQKELETVWIINGEKLTWGSKPIYVLPDKNTLDTIYFKERTNHKWDTIICNIMSDKVYTFIPNDCCGGFNVINKSGIETKVAFNIESHSNKFFLGEYGASAILAKFKKKSTLNIDCSGAMTSNIKYVQLSDIELRKDTSNNATYPLCFFENNGKLSDKDFYYKVNKKLIKFLYMPLDKEIITIDYNPKLRQNDIKIKQIGNQKEYSKN